MAYVSSFVGQQPKKEEQAFSELYRPTGSGAYIPVGQGAGVNPLGSGTVGGTMDVPAFRYTLQGWNPQTDPSKLEYIAPGSTSYTPFGPQNISTGNYEALRQAYGQSANTPGAQSFYEALLNTPEAMAVQQQLYPGSVGFMGSGSSHSVAPDFGGEEQLSQMLGGMFKPAALTEDQQKRGTATATIF